MEGTHIPTDPADRPQEWTSLKRFNASWSKGYPIYTNKFHADNFFQQALQGLRAETALNEAEGLPQIATRLRLTTEILISSCVDILWRFEFW